MGLWPEGYFQEWWNSVEDAKTWYDKILRFVFGKDVSWTDVIDALVITMPWISPGAAGAKAAAKYGDEVGKVVEALIKQEGMQAESLISKVSGILKSGYFQTGLRIVSGITTAIKRFLPWSIADVIGAITGEAAYKLMKKALTDLAANILKPSFKWAADIKDALLKYLVEVNAAFARNMLWRASFNAGIKAWVGANFVKLAALPALIQAQIDKYVIAELVKIRGELAALKADMAVKFTAVNVKLAEVYAKSVSFTGGELAKIRAELAAVRLIAVNTAAYVQAELALIKARQAAAELQRELDVYQTIDNMKSVSNDTWDSIDNANISNVDDMDESITDTLADFENVALLKIFDKIMPTLLESVPVLMQAVDIINKGGDTE